jgi:DNA-directed RNA polymerase subunit beta'
VDVAQDVIINAEDCGTLRGLNVAALKEGDDIIESLSDRIVGRTALLDVVHPISGEVIAAEGELINEATAKQIEEAKIEEVEIRSVLTCELDRGVCSKCYGRNLTNNQNTQIGDAVGIIAAQSIGEPGTQLTLRTFHAGGAAASVAADSSLLAKFDGKLEFDEVKSVKQETEDGTVKQVIIGRTGEINIVDEESGRVLITNNIPYGSILAVKSGQKVT